MLTVDEALQAILEHVQPASPEETPLQECLRRVLAKDLTTPHDSPPFDKSMMDGFAISSSAFSDADSKALNVLETVTAGMLPTARVDATSAVRIMTGAIIPDGADCVVPIERVRFDESSPDAVTVTATEAISEKHILRQGHIAKMGEPLMQAGTLLEPQHIAVLAEFGVASVPTYRRPNVSVLATGDELISVDQPLSPGRIRNSNEPMLVSQIERAGAIAAPLGVAKDTKESLQPRISQGLNSDFLLLSGGVSAGTLDLVPSALASAGVEQVFHKIQMKPGKPLWFGVLKANDRTCCVFGLPGNPVSSMVCFELFVRTALRQFSGQLLPEPNYDSAKLLADVKAAPDRPVYFPCRLGNCESGVTATPVPWGGSADLRSTAEANGMCLLPARKGHYKSGDTVQVLPW